MIYKVFVLKDSYIWSFKHLGIYYEHLQLALKLGNINLFNFIGENSFKINVKNQSYGSILSNLPCNLVQIKWNNVIFVI